MAWSASRMAFQVSCCMKRPPVLVKFDHFKTKLFSSDRSNFPPVDELKEALLVPSIEGNIPDDFTEGVHMRNGPNPIFGGLKSTRSMFGRSSHIWVEGEGMLHALYFDKSSDGRRTVCYKNRHVETETFKLERERNKPSFLPAIEGHSPAILAAYLLNWVMHVESGLPWAH